MTAEKVLLKISGEFFKQAISSSSEDIPMDLMLSEIKSCQSQIGAIVVGGGNIVRGSEENSGLLLPRNSRDTIGMLSTIINAICLQHHLKEMGIDCYVMTPHSMITITKGFDVGIATKDIAKDKIIILAGGLGCGYLSTDTTAVIRALELGLNRVVKITKVNGLYDKDPIKHRDAQHIPRISHHQFLVNEYGIMDLSSIAVAGKSNLNIIISKIQSIGDLHNIINNHNYGTIVTSEPRT